MNEINIKREVDLPALPDTIMPALDELTEALKIPREFLASQDEIEHAWHNLPRELNDIPIDLRGELIARMCIAVSTGLFDGAMNYIWNAAILHLRQKVRNFGIPVVAQILQKDFEEKHLSNLQDSNLLELCLKLNLINEDGFFFLDQCRQVRNNFSAAHPQMGRINDREFITFLNRCIKYALADSASPKGVEIQAFISAVKGEKFNESQYSIWIQRLEQTHDAQRQILVNMLHGIYCDSSTAEPARLNAIDICKGLIDTLTASVKSDLINRHSDYNAKGAKEKHAASVHFFIKLGFLELLNNAEQHSIFSRAIKRLWDVHNGMDNFYNEPPFAERLLEISQQVAIPESVQQEFVETVVSCRIGNYYGVSRAAVQYYDKMIQDFSPREVSIFIQGAVDTSSLLGDRINSSTSCRKHCKAMLSLIDAASVPNSLKNEYNSLLAKLHS